MIGKLIGQFIPHDTNTRNSLQITNVATVIFDEPIKLALDFVPDADVLKKEHKRCIELLLEEWVCYSYLLGLVKV